VHISTSDARVSSLAPEGQGADSPFFLGTPLHAEGHRGSERKKSNEFFSSHVEMCTFLPVMGGYPPWPGRGKGRIPVIFFFLSQVEMYNIY